MQLAFSSTTANIYQGSDSGFIHNVPDRYFSIIPACNEGAIFVILLQVYVAGNNRYLVQRPSIKNFYNTGGK